MTAISRHCVLPETAWLGAIVAHTEFTKKLDELKNQYEQDTQHEVAVFETKKNAILSQFESHLADLERLESALGSTFFKILVEWRDLHIFELERTYKQQQDERTRHYEHERKRYIEENFAAMNNVMSVEVTGLSIEQDDSQAGAVGPNEAAAPSQIDHVAGQIGSVGTASAAPTLEVAEPSSQLPRDSPPERPDPETSGSKAESTPGSPKIGPSEEPSARSPGGIAAHGQASDADELDCSVQPPPQSSAGLNHASSSETLRPVTPPSAGNHEQPLADAETLTRGNDGFHPAPPVENPLKRKADDEPSSAPSHKKRPKPEHAGDTEIADVAPSGVEIRPQVAAKRTISFADVYQDPQYHHIIVQYPTGSGDFYILRCDEHGVHFGENPLRGAAKHLAGAQHDHMTKAHAVAIEMLGHLVVDCTQELADRNNAKVIEAFRRGYKVFNANSLSQTKRAEMGYPPLETPSTQKTSSQRLGKQTASPGRSKKQFTGVINPVQCKFYLSYVQQEEVQCPVLILPWGNLAPAGLQGTLADTGLFSEQADAPEPPKCYVYDRVDGRITGIRGWASGYEDGGPLVRNREFPVLCVDNPDFRSWSVGWVNAAGLSRLSFKDSDSQSVPFFHAAHSYYVERVLRHRKAAEAKEVLVDQDQPRQAPSSVTVEEVEMRDAGPTQADYPERDSDQDSSNKAMTDSDNELGKLDEESRRTSISNQDEHGGEITSMKPTAAVDVSLVNNAQLIATKALGLQPPSRSGFKPINAGSEAPVSRSASASLEPLSRAGSMPGSDRAEILHPRNSRTSPSQPVSSIDEQGDGNPQHDHPMSRSRTTMLKPNPASLQSILQDVLNHTMREPTPSTRENMKGTLDLRSQNGSISRPVIEFAEMQAPTLPAPALSTTDSLPLVDNRAQSVPVQQTRPLEEEKRRADSASAAPCPSLGSTPCTMVSKPIPGREQSSMPIGYHPPPKELPQLLRSGVATPVSTLRTSAFNTQDNTPMQAKRSTPTPVSRMARTDALSQSALGTIPSTTAAVFDLAGFKEGDAELFSARVAGRFLRLVEDPASGVFRTGPDAPVSLTIDPKGIKSVARSKSEAGAVCIARLIYEGGRTQTLVFETSGMQSGKVHARKFCARLQWWNPDITVEMPSSGSDLLDRRRSASQTPSLTENSFRLMA